MATILKLLALGILAGTISTATAGTLILNALAANELTVQVTEAYNALEIHLVGGPNKAK